MRRFIARIAILAVASLGFIGIASAAPASAANCVPTHGSTYWDGYLNFQANLFQCTGVDKVEFKRTAGGTVYGFGATGWGDGTEHDLWGWPGNHPALAGYNADSYVVNVSGSQASAVWRVIAWCGGQTHWVFTQFIYRIHNTAGGGSWGSYYTARSAGYQIVC